ncbi:envelope biogenesis factor ElyC [Thaumasiovibrio sp. DFM-14]|uniref:envelope biogenesis factor ElyC n=1 Tax=Thaumasiovibrio sp. DFM-14 TaxID=3384792 RepID=UPI0039A28CC7
MFELKKIITAFIMPLPALLLLGLCGIIVIGLLKRHRIGLTCITASLLGIFLISFQPISTRLLVPVERHYPAFIPPETSIDFVMVLGSGHVVDEAIPVTSELSRTALMRLAEGIRILNFYPQARLILSGYDGGTSISHARMLAKVAIALGISKQRIILLETAKDTWEEANQSLAIIQDKPFVLVTSASHMPRAINEFEHINMNPIPAPTNFLAHTNIQQPWEKYSPKARYLEQTERYWYETLGQYWQQLKRMLIGADEHISNNG